MNHLIESIYDIFLFLIILLLNRTPLPMPSPGKHHQNSLDRNIIIKMIISEIFNKFLYLRSSTFVKREGFKIYYFKM
jgi:hypothetical protein